MARRRGTSRRKKSSGAVGVFRVFIFLLLVGAGALAWLVFTPFGPETETFVELTPGSSTIQMGRQLEAAGVVRSQFAFDLMRWVRRRTLKAGEYRFDHPAPITEVYARISRGDVYTRTVVIPEGANIFEIAARLEQAGLGERKFFLDAVKSQAGLVADLDPKAASLEGYLFPDTYHFARKATQAQICAAMVRRFRAVAGQIGLKGNVHRVVTMASLVEAGNAQGRRVPLRPSGCGDRGLCAHQPWRCLHPDGHHSGGRKPL